MAFVISGSYPGHCFAKCPQAATTFCAIDAFRSTCCLFFTVFTDGCGGRYCHQCQQPYAPERREEGLLWWHDADNP